MTTWTELAVRVAKTEVDSVELVLTDHEAVAITISSAEQTQAESDAVFDLLDNQLRLWRFVEVVGLFEEDFQLEPLINALAKAGVDRQHLLVKQVKDEDWVLRWQQEQKPLSFGQGLYVCPPNAELPKDAKQVIKLEPGMAFGTGTHPTTAMCLRWIATYPWQGDEIAIDFGCGSSVLAMAMSKCGAKDVYACDIDPTAIEVSQYNLKINEIENTSLYLNQDLPILRADILIANILLEPLIAEKSAIAARLNAGAAIAMSGILSAQAARLIAAYRHEFELELFETEHDWALVAGKKL